MAGKDQGLTQEEVAFSLEQRHRAEESAARAEEDARFGRSVLERLDAQVRSIPGLVEERLAEWQPFLVEVALNVAQRVLHTALDRGDYGVGTGSWAATLVVGGEVDIEIAVEAHRS